MHPRGSLGGLEGLVPFFAMSPLLGPNLLARCVRPQVCAHVHMHAEAGSHHKLGGTGPIYSGISIQTLDCRCWFWRDVRRSR